MKSKDHLNKNCPIEIQALYSEIRETLLSYRKQAYASVNSAIVQTYWNIGRLIVEYEQKGNFRAEYGKRLLQNISQKLTKDFGRGFDIRNLQYMKAFYVSFQKTNAVRSELSWTQYRILLRIENANARNWYMEECIRSAWSSRQLERQINTLYKETSMTFSL